MSVTLGIEGGDIRPVPFTSGGSDHLTEDQARGYLRDSGYEGEAGKLLADASRFPGMYHYTSDRHRYVAHERANSGEWHWAAGDCTRSEERIKALGAARRGIYRGVFTGAAS